VIAIWRKLFGLLNVLHLKFYWFCTVSSSKKFPGALPTNDSSLGTQFTIMLIFPDYSFAFHHTI